MKLTVLFRKSQFPVMVTLGAYALTVFAFGYFAYSVLKYAWVFPAVYLLFAWFGLMLPGKLRVALGILGTMLMLVPSIMFLRSDVRLTVLIISVVHGSLLVWSMRFASWEQDRELPVELIGVLFSFLIVAYFCATYEPRLEQVRFGLQISLFIFVLLAMLSMNRGSWVLAKGVRKGFFLAMQRKTAILTLLMFAVSLMVALIPSVVNILQRVTEWIIELIEMLKSLFPERPEETKPTEPIATAPDMQGWLDSMQSNGTSDRMQMIMWIIAIACMVPLSIAGIYMVIKIVSKQISKLFYVITSGITEEAGDYEDEVTDIRQEVEDTHPKNRNMLRRIMPVFGKMTPTEKIRYRYRKLAQKHPQWGKHSTARENLPDSAAQLYERARYSEHEITEQDADRFITETE